MKSIGILITTVIFPEGSDWGIINFVVQTHEGNQIYPFNYRKPKLINQDSIKYVFYHSKGIKKTVDKCPNKLDFVYSQQET